MGGTETILSLNGTLRFSTKNAKHTCGRFNELITENSNVFKRYFGVDLFPGSLNVDVPQPTSLQQDLDAAKPEPAIVIPKGELINMPDYIGDVMHGHASCAGRISRSLCLVGSSDISAHKCRLASLSYSRRTSSEMPTTSNMGMQS